MPLTMAGHLCIFGSPYIFCICFLVANYRFLGYHLLMLIIIINRTDILVVFYILTCLSYIPIHKTVLYYPLFTYETTRYKI